MNKPEVVVALLVTRKRYSEVLLHLRKGGVAPDTWACPGGKMELWEDFTQTAIRVTLEEAGPDLEYTSPILLDTINTKYPSVGKQFIVIFMYAIWRRGEPRIMEPEKCQEWRWFKWNELPPNLAQGNLILKEKRQHLPAINCCLS